MCVKKTTFLKGFVECGFFATVICSLFNRFRRELFLYNLMDLFDLSCFSEKMVFRGVYGLFFACNHVSVFIRCF